MRTLFLALALLSSWTIAPNAMAQSAQSQIPYCENLDNEYVVDLQIGACTALIQSGDATLFGRTVGFYRRGLAYLRRTDYARAIADITQAIALNPPGVSAPALATMYYYRGLAYGRSTPIDYVHAMADFDQAIRLNPQEAAFLEMRAYTYFELGDRPRSLADYDALVRLSPDDPNALIGRGVAFARLGDEVRAVEDYDRAIAIAPEHQLAFFNRGSARFRQQRYNDAWVDYNRALNLGYSHARYGRGVAALRLGRTTEGQTDIDAATAIEPNVAAAYADKGVTP